jgi:hypothetical protein
VNGSVIAKRVAEAMVRRDELELAGVSDIGKLASGGNCMPDKKSLDIGHVTGARSNAPPIFSVMNQFHQRPVAVWLVAVELATGAGAVLAASYRGLPLILGSLLGVGACLFSTLEFLAGADPRFQRLSGSACVGRVFLRRRGARITAVVLAAASTLVITAANWDALKRPLLKMVRATR